MDQKHWPQHSNIYILVEMSVLVKLSLHHLWKKTFAYEIRNIKYTILNQMFFDLRDILQADPKKTKAIKTF